MSQNPFVSYRQALLAEIRQHRLTAYSLLATLVVMLALLLFNSLSAIGSWQDPRLQHAIGGGLGGFGSTAVGALLALLLGRLSTRSEDTLLGFAAGMMLAASAFALILPGIEAGQRLTGSPVGSLALVLLGLALGVALMLGLDRFTPHEHMETGPCGPDCERISRVWLFVLAIALHNLPEGMAIGVSFADGDNAVGIPLTAAILLQNVPEGLAVTLALRTTGLGALPAALTAAATGLMEPLGAMLGIGVAAGLPLAYPVGLGLAAGAMIFVVSHEVIPETHRNGHQTAATLGLMGGFALMLVMDTLLG
ncbi:ZIP family metal transporter [Zobellella taiwanensis]|jgi:ZIP family zinc transporter